MFPLRKAIFEAARFEAMPAEQRHGLEREDAIGAPAIGDHFLPGWNFAEPLLEFLHRDVERAWHMAGGVLLRRPHVEDRHPIVAHISAKYPTDVNNSLALLRPRGGEIGPHADGWGVAFHEGNAARVFKEPIPAAESRCLAFISEYDFKSTTVIAHIRKANPAEISRASANTHPFERELGGRSWVFAHNGKLPGLRDDPAAKPRRFQPIGETDSEYAFCLLLDRIARRRTIDGLVEAIREPVRRLAAMGEFNFMLSDGAQLIVHPHTKLFIARRACVESGCDQRVVLLATTPLTDEPWHALAREQLYVYRAGEELAHNRYGSIGVRRARQAELALH